MRSAAPAVSRRCQLSIRRTRRCPRRRQARGRTGSWLLVGGCSVLAAGASCLVHPLKFGFERRDRLIEHAAMRRRSGGVAIATRAYECQLERLTPGARLTLFRRQRSAQRLRALGFGLLKLNVFALESS